jgi:hypothetical protein
MKFGIKCKVDSTTEIGKEPVQVTVDGMDFILVPSEDGLLSELTVIVRIDNPDGFIACIGPSGEFAVDYDKQIYDKLVDMVQYIEGSLSFVEVKKIYWEEPELVYIPESEEDKKKINTTDISVHRQYPEPPRKKLSAGSFKEIVQQKSKDESFTIVKLFHREGVKEFHVSRYIQAYYNFYFVLEDLYAQGKTNNNQIREKLQSNQTFRAIMQDVLDTAIKPHQNHHQNIQNFLREEGLTFDIDGFIGLIVQVRGNLHHYSGKSTKKKGTPLNQRDFVSMAYLLMGLSVKSIIHAQYGNT